MTKQQRNQGGLWPWTIAFGLFISVSVGINLILLAKVEKFAVQYREEKMNTDAIINKLQDKLLDTRATVWDILLKLVNGSDDIITKSIPQRSKRSADSDLAEDDLSQLTLAGLSFLRGPPGRDGHDGHDGINGINGRDGRDGSPGAQGLKGDTGPKGDTGSKGEPGILGTPENNGLSGQKGDKGMRSERGMYGSKGSRGSGATAPHRDYGNMYTRWGRTSCSNVSQLIYEGFVSGVRHSLYGGGTNYQCLPLDPEWNLYSTRNAATISAGEFYNTDGIFSISQHQNIPCARCFTISRTSVMMIPAKRNCPSNWTKEYEGYLMTSAGGDHHSTTYECMDGNPEYISNSSGYAHGATMYFVKSDCSGDGAVGHCPPYSANKQLTCVVCTC